MRILSLLHISWPGDSTEGTELHRTGGRDDIYSPEIEKAIQNIMNRVFGIFADDVAHINLNSNEDSNI